MGTYPAPAFFFGGFGESAPAFSPGPFRISTSCPAVPAMYLISEISLGAGTSPIGSMHELHAYTYTVCVSGSYDPPGQLVPPEAVPSVRVPRGPSTLLTTGGVYTGPRWYLDTISFARSRSAGVKSIRSSMELPLRLYAAGFVGIGCVGEYHSPGTFPTSTGMSARIGAEEISMSHSGWCTN